MAFIECWTCHKEKRPTDFNWKNKKLNQRKGYCRDCDRAIKRRFYERNKKRVGRENAQRRTTLREEYQQWKATQQCCCCGEKDPCCLDLHHLESTSKDETVSNLVGSGVGWKRIKQEIDKCIVVCRNCHAKIHEHGLEKIMRV